MEYIVDMFYLSSKTEKQYHIIAYKEKVVFGFQISIKSILFI